MNTYMPAMPTGNGESTSFSKIGALTKRETIAKDMDVSSVEFPSMESLEEFIGCKVDQSNIISIIESGAKATAKLKVMFADALLEELERDK